MPPSIKKSRKRDVSLSGSIPYSCFQSKSSGRCGPWLAVVHSLISGAEAAVLRRRHAPHHHATVRNRILILIKREDDIKSWRDFLVYFSHSNTMSCPLRSWRYIIIGC
jgi:hypothetical protein